MAVGWLDHVFFLWPWSIQWPLALDQQSITFILCTSSFRGFVAYAGLCANFSIGTHQIWWMVFICFRLDLWLEDLLVSGSVDYGWRWGIWRSYLKDPDRDQHFHCYDNGSSLVITALHFCLARGARLIQQFVALHCFVKSKLCFPLTMDRNPMAFCKAHAFTTRSWSRSWSLHSFYKLCGFW